jgi:hypothetical protein
VNEIEYKNIDSPEATNIVLKNAGLYTNYYVNEDTHEVTIQREWEESTKFD